MPLWAAVHPLSRVTLSIWPLHPALSLSNAFFHLALVGSTTLPLPARGTSHWGAILVHNFRAVWHLPFRLPLSRWGRRQRYHVIFRNCFGASDLLSPEPDTQNSEGSRHQKESKCDTDDDAPLETGLVGGWRLNWRRWWRLGAGRGIESLALRCQSVHLRE